MNDMRLPGTGIIRTETFSDEICAYLDQEKKAGAKDKIFKAFELADQKRIVFVGEGITDVYRYVQGLGRASKELMLATVLTGSESFNGGVWAAAKHGEWTKRWTLASPEDITKTRYVDSDFNKKVFDVYSAREIDLDPEEREHFRNALADAVGLSDVVIVNDFGHGLLGELERGILSNAGFLAVNCQTNAGNYGFNLITKYKNANYICVDEPEIRLAMGLKNEPIERGVPSFGRQIGCYKFLITHGRFGSNHFDIRFVKNGAGHIMGYAPALAQGGIDTMGAGDAVMAVTAPLIAAGLDMASAALVGNIVGAIKISILGHRRHVGRQEIIQTVEALLA